MYSECPTLCGDFRDTEGFQNQVFFYKIQMRKVHITFRVFEFNVLVKKDKK